MLKLLAELNAEQADGLEKALKAVPTPILRVRNFARAAEASLPEGFKERSAEVIQVLLSLAGQSRFHAWKLAELAEGVAGSRDLELKTRQRTSLREILSRLLSVPSVLAVGKSFDVATEFDRIYHSSRIITDLRPVFADDPATPLGVVLVHTLKVDYVRNGEMESAFFGLDDQDISELKKVIERAENKSKALEGLTDAAAITRFRVEDDLEE
ncbi:MAG TPA: hypothetical protein VGB83_02435 [Actinomycetota bacterium]